MAKKVEKKKPVFITSTSIQLLSVQQQIFVIRGKQVMVDRDLAALYGVETRVLKQAVKRNPERFPEEFMFQLDNQEFEKWRSQIVMSNSDKMGLRYPPFAFTEQGGRHVISSTQKSYSYFSKYRHNERLCCCTAHIGST